jgi:hypothetical protein
MESKASLYQKKFQAMSLEEHIVNLIRCQPHTSFAELMHIKGFSKDKGFALITEKHEMLWYDMTKEAIDIMKKLIHNNIVRVEKVDELIYVMDGVTIALPPDEKIKWLPVVFSIGDDKAYPKLSDEETAFFMLFGK